MKTPTKEQALKAVDHAYFRDVRAYLKGYDNAAQRVITVLGIPYKEQTLQERDVFHAWCKYRALELDNVKDIIPKNTETHTIVTELGHVCVIRKPMGRILGQVMSKLSNINKEPDFYQAGTIILRECKIYMDKAIETNPDEYFSLKMACLNVVQIMEASIKKN